MNVIANVLLAFFGYSVFATGNVLQKKGVSCLHWRGQRDEKFRINLITWLIGIFLTYIVSMAPTWVASRSLPPYIVSAISGWSIPLVIILSHFLLKEKLYFSDLFFSGVIIVCILTTALVQEENLYYNINEFAMYLFIFLPFLLLVPAFSYMVSRKVKAVLFATFGGIGDGLAIVLSNLMTKEFGTEVMKYVTSPYIYIFVFIGIATAVSLQFAYKNGEMVLIAPLQTSLNIIYPIICSYLVFDMPLKATQVVSICVIIISCYGIQRKH